MDEQRKLTGLQRFSAKRNQINIFFDVNRCLHCKKYCTVFPEVGILCGDIIR
jgi:hypothetical protein